MNWRHRNRDVSRQTTIVIPRAGPLLCRVKAKNLVKTSHHASPTSCSGGRGKPTAVNEKGRAIPRERKRSWLPVEDAGSVAYILAKPRQAKKGKRKGSTRRCWVWQNSNRTCALVHGKIGLDRNLHVNLLYGRPRAEFDLWKFTLINKRVKYP